MKAGFWEEICYQDLQNINRDGRSKSYLLRVIFNKCIFITKYNKINGAIRRHFVKQMNKETK